MSKKEKKKGPLEGAAETPQEETAGISQEETAGKPEDVQAPETAQEAPVSGELEELKAQLAAKDQELEALRAQLTADQDKFLRLCAEYDNFRKRTQKEKENIYRARTTREKERIYADAKADTVKALLSVYDNLERALKQDTADEAYKKGVEMTMAGLKKAFEGLGVTEIDAVGQPFDPNVHNAVMHMEDDSLGENTVAEVFQAGFKLGDKVIRFAMVKVAN